MSVNGKEIEIALEAELAQKVQEPMIVDDDDVGKDASNGKFIWMEGKPATGGGGKGWAEFSINLPESGKVWHWDRINHWLDAGTFDREWKFKEKGETVLRIAVREDATMLDAIFVTSNVKAKKPGEANVRLPTKKDIKIQVEGLAVNQRGKITTTWARIKSLP